MLGGEERKKSERRGERSLSSYCCWGVRDLIIVTFLFCTQLHIVPRGYCVAPSLARYGCEL